jgi:hypothetical protein
MTTMVEADHTDAVHGALLNFCMANVHKAKAHAAASEQARLTRDQVRTYTQLLADEMVRTGETARCVQLPAGIAMGRGAAVTDGAAWAVLQPVRSAPKKLCATAAVDALRDVTTDAIRAASASDSMAVALAEYIRKRFEPQFAGRYTVRLQSKPPRAVPPLRVAPPGAPDCTGAEVAPTGAAPLEASTRCGRAGAEEPGAHASVRSMRSEGLGAASIAHSLVHCRADARQQRAHFKEQTRGHDAACDLAREAVEQYVREVSPVTRVAPVQLEMNGAASRFYVRAREVRHVKALSLRAFVPLCAVALQDALRATGMCDDITDNAVQRVRSEEWLLSVLERLHVGLERHSAATQRVTTKLTLERGLPRARARRAGLVEPG